MDPPDPRDRGGSGRRWLLAGRTWARVVGITLAVLSAIANLMFIPHHPVWALLVIALDVFVIWALAAHGRELRDASA
jgi:hypothetical protein